MDAEVAALIGAAIGSAGTLSAAWLTGRLQGQSQHAQWRREVRRAAYAAFQAQFKRAVRDLRYALEEGVGPAASDQGRELLADGIRDLELAAAAVTLEGPPSLGEKAEELVQRYVGLVLGVQLDEPGEVAPFRPRELDEGLREFTEQARSLMDE